MSEQLDGIPVSEGVYPDVTKPLVLTKQTHPGGDYGAGDFAGDAAGRGAGGYRLRVRMYAGLGGGAAHAASDLGRQPDRCVDVRWSDVPVPAGGGGGEPAAGMEHHTAESREYAAERMMRGQSCSPAVSQTY